MINSIFIKFGDKCNLKCSYCFQDKNNIEYAYNKNFIKELSNKYPSYVKFILIGGEPLLWKDNIKESIIILKENNHPITLVTNGSLLNIDMIEFLNEYNVKVTISWDGEYSSLDRGYDAFSNKDIYKIHNLNFSSLITNHSFLKDKFSPYDKLNEKRIGIGLDCATFNIKLTYGLIYTDSSLIKLRKESLLLGILSQNSYSAKVYIDKIKTYKNNIMYSCNANITQLAYTCSGDKIRCLSAPYDEKLVDEPFYNNYENCSSCDLSKLCTLPCYYKTKDISNFCKAQHALHAFFL